MDVGSMAVAERVARDVTITSERRDRARDIVRVAGGLFDDYVRNPVVLLNHDPVWVGTARSLRARPLSTGVPSIGADIVWSRGVLVHAVQLRSRGWRCGLGCRSGRA